MLRSVSETAKASTFTLALAAILARGAARAYRLFKNRVAVARLGDLDDRALKDIGLTRSDVSAALSMPFGSDPSEHLREVAGHKRSPTQEYGGHAVPVARLRNLDADVTKGAAQACPI